MLTLMIVASLVLAIIVNVATSVYVCYNVATDADEPTSTLFTVSGLILVNVLVPYIFGCMTGLWYIP